MYFDELVPFCSKLRFLDFATPFRTALVYNNILYGLAEYVLQTLDGRPWKDIVREELFQVASRDVTPAAAVVHLDMSVILYKPAPAMLDLHDCV